MIVLNMDMPNKCMNCQLLGRDAMYCQVYPRRDLNVISVANGRPDWCPIKCSVEDIKNDIENERDCCEFVDRTLANGLRMAFNIINKHCGEDK